MRQSLDHAGHDILAAILFTVYFITNIHNILPVLGGEVLVGRLSYEDSRISTIVFRLTP